MPFAIIALHLFLICAAVILLMLLCSTGNFWRYPGACVWICLDLMVSICGVAYALHPEYPALIARLALFHLVAMFGCLAWMGWDCWREAHALSGIFFWAFAAYAALRVGQLMAYEWHMAPPVVLEIGNAVGYLMVVGLLIASLLLPVPPDPVVAPAQTIAALRAPMLPAAAFAEVRQ